MFWGESANRQTDASCWDNTPQHNTTQCFLEIRSRKVSSFLFFCLLFSLYRLSGNAKLNSRVCSTSSNDRDGIRFWLCANEWKLVLLSPSMSAWAAGTGCSAQTAARSWHSVAGGLSSFCSVTCFRLLNLQEKKLLGAVGLTEHVRGECGWWWWGGQSKYWG